VILEQRRSVRFSLPLLVTKGNEFEVLEFCGVGKVGEMSSLLLVDLKNGDRRELTRESLKLEMSGTLVQRLF
jgi:hypothetical protein